MSDRPDDFLEIDPIQKEIEIEKSPEAVAIPAQFEAQIYSHREIQEAILIAVSDLNKNIEFLNKQLLEVFTLLQ